jgi:hypothetical protein
MTLMTPPSATTDVSRIADGEVPALNGLAVRIADALFTNADLSGAGLSLPANGRHNLSRCIAPRRV